MSGYRVLAVVLWMAGGLAEAREDLLSLYQEAQTASAGYLAAQAGGEALKENENIARAQLLPSVSISGSYGRNDADRQVGNMSAENFKYDSYAYSLNFRQPLYRQYNWAAYAQAQAQATLGNVQQDQAKQDLILRLAGAYLEVLYAEDQMALIAAQKKAIAAQLDAAQKGFLAGSGTRIDIDEAQARYDMVLAQEIEADNQRFHSFRALEAIVNREVTALAPLDLQRFTLDFPEPGEVGAWVAAAEQNNPEYQAQRLQVQVAEQEVKKASSGHHPSLDLVASTGRNGNDSLSSLSRSGDTRYDTSNYGLQLTIPLFTGGQVSAEARRAVAKLEEARQQAEEMRRNIHVQTRREFNNVVQGIARVKALQRAHASASQMLQSARKGIEAGVRSTLDALQAEEDHATVTRDLAQARYAYLIALLRLKALGGGLARDDVVKLNTLLLH